MSTINYATLSNESYKVLLSLEDTLKQSSLEKGLIDLIKIRASQINGCAFCIDMHIKEARIRGERELRLHHLVAWQESPLFSPKEKAALGWSELVTNVSKGVPEEELTKLCEHFSEKEISDLTFAIISINAWNRLGVTFHKIPGSLDKFLGLDKAGLN